MICVIDACFVIDWSLYGRRDILKDIFSSFYITADVFDELKSERAYNMIIEWRRENICVIVGLYGEGIERCQGIDEASG